MNQSCAFLHTGAKGCAWGKLAAFCSLFDGDAVYLSRFFAVAGLTTTAARVDLGAQRRVEPSIWVMVRHEARFYPH